MKEHKPMRILVDMDSILVDTLSAWLAEHNEAQGDTITIEQVSHWDFHSIAKGGKALYEPLARPGFYRALKPLPGGVEAVQELLRRGHEVFIVSTSMHPLALAEKAEWCAEYLPFLDQKHVVFAHEKHIIVADAIIDDGPHNATAYAKAYPSAKVLGIGYPYNKDCPHYTLLAGDWRDPAAAWAQILEELP